MTVQTFQSLIAIYRRGNFVCINFSAPVLSLKIPDITQSSNYTLMYLNKIKNKSTHKSCLLLLPPPPPTHFNLNPVSTIYLLYSHTLQCNLWLGPYGPSTPCVSSPPLPNILFHVKLLLFPLKSDVWKICFPFSGIEPVELPLFLLSLFSFSRPTHLPLTSFSRRQTKGKEREGERKRMSCKIFQSWLLSSSPGGMELFYEKHKLDTAYQTRILYSHRSIRKKIYKRKRLMLNIFFSENC